jgi:uncharacterized RDD family membrane protein YckC
VTQPPPQPYPPPPGYPLPPGGYTVPQQYGPPVYRPKPTGPGGLPLAEFGERLLAYLLDGLILTAILFVPMVVVMVAIMIPYINTMESVSHGGAPNPAVFLATFFGLFIGIFGLQILATYLYQVTYQIRKGQTVGKRVMKLKIIDAETGQPMDLPTARKRWGIYILLSLAGPGAYLDGLWQLWDERKQTLHDKVARTVVVKVPA